MKVLAAGDLHFQKDRFNSLRTMSLDCDVLCLTGDYLDDRKGDRDMQIDWVSKWMASISMPILMCSGNHDLDGFAQCEWIEKFGSKNVKIDNSIWTYRGITFGVVPFIGARFSEFSRCDILVSHLPPSNTKTSMQDGNDFGDDELYFSLARRVIEPKYIFCGHVEKPEEVMDRVGGTQIINASSSFYVIDL